MRESDRVGALDPTRGMVRVLRASAVGAAAVGVSLAGHVCGHAAVPPYTTLGPLVIGVSLVAWSLSAARWTVASLTGALLAAQSVLHLIFTQGADDAGSHQTVPMLAGHVVATVVMVALLNGGESLLWAVVESLGLRVWRKLSPVALASRPTVPRPVGRPRVAMPRCWHGQQPPRRGPPLRSSSVPIPA